MVAPSFAREVQDLSGWVRSFRAPVTCNSRFTVCEAPAEKRDE